MTQKLLKKSIISIQDSMDIKSLFKIKKSNQIMILSKTKMISYYLIDFKIYLNIIKYSILNMNFLKM
jgi:hypothetical protein